MQWRSYVVVTWLGLLLSAPVARGPAAAPTAAAPGEPWKLTGAKAALALGDPAVAPPALRTLGVLRSPYLRDWLVTGGDAMARGDAAVREEAAWALGELAPAPALVEHVLQSWKLSGYPGVSAACDTLRRWRASGDPLVATSLAALVPPPRTDLGTWRYCVGVWTQADVDALISEIHGNGLQALYLLRGVAPRERAEAAGKLLVRFAASSHGRWLEALGMLGHTGAEVIAQLERAAATPALRREALGALAELVARAPAGTFSEPQLHAWGRLAAGEQAAFALASPRLQAELAAQLGRSAASGCVALQELPEELAWQPKIAPALLEAIRGKLAARDPRARACGARLGYGLLAYEPALLEPLAQLLRATPEAQRDEAQLAALVAAGGAGQLVPELTAAYRRAAEPQTAPLGEVSEALAGASLDAAARAALRPALLAYLQARAAGWSDDGIGPALLAVGPISQAEGLALIELTHAGDARLRGSDIDALRAWAIVLTAGDPAVGHAATWLAARARRIAPSEPPAAQAAVDATLAVVRLLRQDKAGLAGGSGLGSGTPSLPDVDSSALAFLRTILDDARWTRADVPFLRGLLEVLPAQPELAAVRAAVERRLAQLEAKPAAPSRAAPPLPLRLAGWAVGALGLHFFVWLGLLLTVYPRSRLVQAAMLFNPLGRAITGLGYTQLLVLASPWLRRRLFHPLVDAGRDTEVASYDATSFYDQIRVAPILPRANPQAPHELGPPIAWTRLAAQAGVVVIEGASGLGKTHVLKALLERARAAGRTCLFLRAGECNGGVMKEIEDRLAVAHSGGFVHSMIHRGAIELYIDGLNEAQPSGVAEIAQFCERARNARILITTQPMSWACPRRAHRFRLLPLSPDELEAFLLAQWPAVRGAPEAASAAASPGDPSAEAPGEPAGAADAAADSAEQAYRARVRAFLAGRTSPRDLAVLQNRIDLAFVAHLLARGQRPNIHSLRKQVVDDAAAAYEVAAPGGAFPLAELGAAAVRVLESGNPVLDVKGVDPSALAQLVERKLLLHRGDGAWLFRHDTITCYFAAQGVFAPLIGDERVDERAITSAHLTSPRFSGVYLQLAESLPRAAAEALAAALRDHGRDTHDRTLQIAYQDLLDHRAE